MDQVFEYAYSQAEAARRKPVIESDRQFRDTATQLQRGWGLITKAILQEMRVNPNLRSAIAPFIQTPLSETVPSQLLQVSIQASPRIDRLYTRYKPLFDALLALPPVPEHLLDRDVKTTEHSIHLPDIASYYKNGDEAERQDIVVWLLNFSKTPERKGVTNTEKELIWLRYPMARDVKLLALAAVWQDHPPTSSELTSNTTLLSTPEHGVHAVSNTQDTKLLARLINPANWERRVQIKDRVYRIQVDGKPYILKEQKTNRHRDTMSSGHKITHSSLKEFLIAQQFSDEGNRSGESLDLIWEKPIGAVEFPDGYQFVVFEYQDDLIEGERTTYHLMNSLIQNWDCLEPDYKDAISSINSILAESTNALNDPDLPTLVDGKFTCTREDYIQARLRYIIDVTLFLRDSVISELGYRNKDAQSPAYRVIRSGNTLRVQMFGYDFEYYVNDEAVTKPRNSMFDQRKRSLSKEQFLLYSFFFAREPIASYQKV